MIRKWFLVILFIMFFIFSTNSFTHLLIYSSTHLQACECEKNKIVNESMSRRGDEISTHSLIYSSTRLLNNSSTHLPIHSYTVLYPEECKNIKFIGAEKCKLCHSVEYRKWQNTKHARAYEKSVNEWKSESVNVFKLSTHLSINSFTHQPKYSSTHLPINSLTYCEPCHTTGYGYKFGFVDNQISKELTGVQCEICHGPGGEHSKNPKGIKMAYGSNPIQEDLCRSCHREDISKGFEFLKNIEKIKCKDKN